MSRRERARGDSFPRARARRRASAPVGRRETSREGAVAARAIKSSVASRRRRRRRTTTTETRETRETRAVYFARVDASTLAVDDDDDDDCDCDDFGAVGTPSGRRRASDPTRIETLPPVFPTLTDAVVRAVRRAKETPRTSDPVAAIRRVARDGRARRLAAAAGRRAEVERETVEADEAMEIAREGDGEGDAMETGDSPRRDVRPRTNDDAEDADDGVFGLLTRAARDERAPSLPSTYAVQEVRASDPVCDDLVRLSVAFASEDPRVGSLVGGLGAATAHVLRDDGGVAVGYTLTHENRAPEWDLSRAVALPPRLSHVFISRENRERGLGTGLVDWWRRRFALRCALFAVDSPNDRVERALRRVECSMATTRSGHDASSVHYLAPCVARTSSRRESGRDE